MLHLKKFWLLKSPTVCQYCTELTNMNNEEIIYTLLNIFKCDITSKKPINKGLGCYKKSRLQSVT